MEIIRSITGPDAEINKYQAQLNEMMENSPAELIVELKIVLETSSDAKAINLALVIMRRLMKKIDFGAFDPQFYFSILELCPKFTYTEDMTTHSANLFGKIAARIIRCGIPNRIFETLNAMTSETLAFPLIALDTILRKTDVDEFSFLLETLASIIYSDAVSNDLKMISLSSLSSLIPSIQSRVTASKELSDLLLYAVNQQELKREAYMCWKAYYKCIGTDISILDIALNDLHNTSISIFVCMVLKYVTTESSYSTVIDSLVKLMECDVDGVYHTVVNLIYKFPEQSYYSIPQYFNSVSDKVRNILVAGFLRSLSLDIPIDQLEEIINNCFSPIVQALSDDSQVMKRSGLLLAKTVMKVMIVHQMNTEKLLQVVPYIMSSGIDGSFLALEKLVNVIDMTYLIPSLFAFYENEEAVGLLSVIYESCDELSVFVQTIDQFIEFLGVCSFRDDCCAIISAFASKMNVMILPYAGVLFEYLLSVVDFYVFSPLTHLACAIKEHFDKYIERTIGVFISTLQQMGNNDIYISALSSIADLFYSFDLGDVVSIVTENIFAVLSVHPTINIREAAYSTLDSCIMSNSSMMSQYIDRILMLISNEISATDTSTTAMENVIMLFSNFTDPVYYDIGYSLVIKAANMTDFSDYLVELSADLFKYLIFCNQEQMESLAMSNKSVMKLISSILENPNCIEYSSIFNLIGID